jgi:hypothetical protein
MKYDASVAGGGMFPQASRRSTIAGRVFLVIGRALLIPAVAGASSLPKTDTHRIVPNKSIGGV